jgi:hypothetical protein
LKPDTKTLAHMLAQLTDPDSIAVLLDTFRPVSQPAETPCEPPETLFGHYQARTPEKDAVKQNRRWSRQERARLKELHGKGYSVANIAAQLQRTPGGVKRQIDHMEGRA